MNVITAGIECGVELVRSKSEAECLLSLAKVGDPDQEG